MKYKKEVEDNIKNLLYYKDKIMAAISKQIDEDFKEVQTKGLNQESCEKRWRSLSLAHAQCFQIQDQTDYVIANVRHAEVEDKVFNIPEVVPEIVKQEEVLDFTLYKNEPPPKEEPVQLEIGNAILGG